MTVISLYIISVYWFLAITETGSQQAQPQPANNAIHKCHATSKLPTSMNVDNCTSSPCQVKVGQTMSIKVTFDTGACKSISCRPAYTNQLFNQVWMAMPCVNMCDMGCKCPTKEGDTCSVNKSGAVPPLVLTRMEMKLQIVLCCHLKTEFGCFFPGIRCPPDSVEITCVTTEAVVNPRPPPPFPVFPPVQPLPSFALAQPAAPPKPFAGFPVFPAAQPAPLLQPGIPPFAFPGFPPPNQG